MLAATLWLSVNNQPQQMHRPATKASLDCLSAHAIYTVRNINAYIKTPFFEICCFNPAVFAAVARRFQCEVLAICVCCVIPHTEHNAALVCPVLFVAEIDHCPRPADNIQVQAPSLPSCAKDVERSYLAPLAAMTNYSRAETQATGLVIRAMIPAAPFDSSSVNRFLLNPGAHIPTPFFYSGAWSILGIKEEGREPASGVLRESLSIAPTRWRPGRDFKRCGFLLRSQTEIRSVDDASMTAMGLFATPSPLGHMQQCRLRTCVLWICRGDCSGKPWRATP